MSGRTAELYKTDDVDLLSKRYYAAPIDYVQTSPGKLGAEIYAVATSRVEVREALFESAVMNLIERPMPRFGIALGTQGQAQLFGSSLTSSNIGFITGRNGVIARIGDGSGWCNITIDDALLQEVAAVHNYLIPTEDGSYGLPTNERTVLLRRLSRAARSQELHIQSDEQFNDAMSLLVLRSLNPAKKQSSYKSHRSWGITQDIIGYIHANYSDCMTLTGLCQLAGVSERTLRYNFTSATGMSLQQYLTHFRLHRAHALLLEGKVAEVRDAAIACGIPHAGRFSQYFKAMFGESPSEVLKRPPPVFRGRSRF
jgi:AraC-like DNA-binding protein